MPRIRLDIQISEREAKLVTMNSLERVLNALQDAKTREGFLQVQYDAAYLTDFASRLWYAASGNVVAEDE